MVRDSKVLKKFLLLGLCFVSFVLLFVVLSISKSNRQKSLIDDMKLLSYFEYYYLSGETNVADVTRVKGHEYGIAGGMGNKFGQANLHLWQETTKVDSALDLEPLYLLRIADANDQKRGYADLTINFVKNSEDQNICNYVDDVGFSYDQKKYVVISDGLIYEIADKTFFCDLLAFLDSEGVLPPNVK
mgnify:CR=1 FL=1|nr:hypothetical protein [uncultured Flavonifractor sp.]